MDIRQRLSAAIQGCEKFQYRRYFILLILERLKVLESEYHASIEENRNKDYTDVLGSLTKITDSLQVMRNRPNFDMYGSNIQFWDSYKQISQLFNEIVLRLQRCGFVYTCGIDKGIFDLRMVSETGVFKRVFQNIDAMHESSKEAFKKWGIRKDLQSELSILLWYSEIQTVDSKSVVDQLSLDQLQVHLDSFSKKLENIRFTPESLEKLQKEKSFRNAVDKYSTKYKPGFIGVEYIEALMTIVYADPSLKYSIFSRECLANGGSGSGSGTGDLSNSVSYFGSESVMIPHAEPLMLQVVECPMDLSNVRLLETIKITQRTITLGNNPEKPLNQPGFVYFGRQTNKTQQLIQNDVSFPSQVTRVSRQQFQIVSQSMNYYSIICTSPSNPTSVKVQEQPYELERNMIFKLGEYKFLVCNLKNGEQNLNQHVNMKEQPLIKLNLNDDADPVFDAITTSAVNYVDFLDQSTSSQNIFGGNTMVSDESMSLKVAESTIQLKNNRFNKPQQATKPFIELKCIQGGFKSPHFNEKEIYREEISDEKGSLVITFGRDQRNKFQFPEKEISRFHCQIVFDGDKEQRWKICERFIADQKNLSSGGTYIQLQNYEQNKNEQYSNPCPLQKGMLIYSEGTTFKVI